MLEQETLIGITQETPRDLGALCQELGTKINTRTKKVSFIIPHTQEITRYLGTLCQELETKTKCVSLFMPHNSI